MVQANSSKVHSMWLELMTTMVLVWWWSLKNSSNNAWFVVHWDIMWQNQSQFLPNPTQDNHTLECISPGATPKGWKIYIFIMHFVALLVKQNGEWALNVPVIVCRLINAYYSTVSVLSYLGECFQLYWCHNGRYLTISLTLTMEGFAWWIRTFIRPDLVTQSKQRMYTKNNVIIRQATPSFQTK